MTTSNGLGPHAHRESARLADEGRWGALRDLLEEVDSGSLRYRYGQALYHTGRLKELSDFAGEYEAAARRRADGQAVMRAMNLSFVAAFELGRTEEAAVAARRLLELAEYERSDEMVAKATNNLGVVANLGGLPYEAISHYQAAVALYEPLGERRGLAQTYHNLAISYRDILWYYDASEAYRRAREMASSVGYEQLVVLSTSGRAEVELRRGDREMSRALAELGLGHAGRLEDPVCRAEALRVHALVRAEDGRDGVSEARQSLRTALGLAHASGQRLLEAEVERDLGLLLLLDGEERAGRQRLDRALALFRELGAAGEARRTAERMEALEAASA